MTPRLTCPKCGTALYRIAGDGRYYHECPGPTVIKQASRSGGDPSPVGTAGDTDGSAPAEKPGTGQHLNRPRSGLVTSTALTRATDALLTQFDIEELGATVGMPGLTMQDVSRLNKITEIYSGLPTVACQGKCWRSCSNPPITILESKLIQVTHGLEIVHIPSTATNQGLRESTLCRALDRETRRCLVYPERPLACRTFGLMHQCPWGCERERELGPLEYAALQSAVDLLGEVPGVSRSAIMKRLKSLEIPRHREEYLKIQEEALAETVDWWRRYKQRYPNADDY